RKLITAAFTPKAMASVRESVEVTVDRLFQSAADVQELDFMVLVAQPLPMRVIARIVGLPEADEQRLQRWSDALTTVLEPGSSFQARCAADAAVREFGTYVKLHVGRRRRQRGTSAKANLIDSLIEAECGNGRLEELELLGIVMLLVLAGFETTSNLLGNGLLALLRHRDQLVRLRENPRLTDYAVEEFLRYDTPAAVNGRVVLQDVSLNGKRLRAGELVFCMLSAANRDPAVFQDPDRLDISRYPNPHLSFGGGGRYCVGAPLARLEAQVVFERLTSWWREIELDEAGVQWRNLVNLRGLQRLPIRVVH
ncbi:MAG TPA: cytochrome P450, partial [Candidatus Binatia bacterium]|nr:cytochrome P450 [Candidatus Binatia bacterium]